MSIALNNDADDKKSDEGRNKLQSKNNSVKELSSQISNPSAPSSYHAMPSSSGLGLSRKSVPPPLTSTEARIQTVELLSQIGENVQEVIAALSDLHTYWEHR